MSQRNFAFLRWMLLDKRAMDSLDGIIDVKPSVEEESRDVSIQLNMTKKKTCGISSTEYKKRKKASNTGIENDSEPYKRKSYATAREEIKTFDEKPGCQLRGVNCVLDGYDASQRFRPYQHQKHILSVTGEDSETESEADDMESSGEDKEKTSSSTEEVLGDAQYVEGLSKINSFPESQHAVHPQQIVPLVPTTIPKNLLRELRPLSPIPSKQGRPTLISDTFYTSTPKHARTCEHTTASGQESVPNRSKSTKKPSIDRNHQNKSHPCARVRLHFAKLTGQREQEASVISLEPKIPDIPIWPCPLMLGPSDSFIFDYRNSPWIYVAQ